MDPFYYYTIEQPSMAEFKDRGSKFFAFAYPAKDIDSCKKILAQLKKEHGKAVHHCLAYRLGVDGSTFRVSDDGEPAGSINAYKTATALALQLSPIIKKPIEIAYELNFDYHQMNEVMLLVKQYNCSVVEQTAQLFIQLQIGIPKNRLDEVLEKLGALREVSFKTTLKLD
jgi:putative IMPACT (imprinted ancient) family translation regulator